MATTHPHAWYDLTRHRRWEDITSLAIGVLVIISPLFIGEAHEAAVYVSAGLAGCMIAALALLEMVSLRRWEEVLEIGFGAWLVIAPFTLGYGGMTAAFHMVAGVLVIVLALLELWQDRRLED
ncbi:MAG: hypothetical protein BroJett030_20550 [Alphaproteobacteria bacterium]|nr:MAG: hypothetical protein BroJett030_20550 [Alphaproteobacteria bacterium]